MYKRMLLVIMILMVYQTAIAEPIILKCITSEGQKVVEDLIVDIEKKEMTWGEAKYYITHINDIYISAYQKKVGIGSGVGGEVLVINRVSGVYKRGMVGLFISGKSGDQESLEAYTWEGSCSKQQF